jgi:crotonobetainyl-CoA:carnitine CoA-transferase CaiB-like acyl-CoA transferase
MQDFFRGLKVIELANVLAGPAVGMFFAELGAEVTKVENPKTNGDVTRSWKLPSENKENPSSAYYASVNWNKTTVFADLGNGSEKKKILELISGADIVISNYKAGDAEKLGMDAASLRKLKPSLIYAHISGFGEDSSRTAFDLVLQAESGFMQMNGNAESGPLKMPVALIDVIAAHHLKEGILLALIKRMRTGEGSFVHVSLLDAAVSSLANQASNWLMAGQDAEPRGSLHPNIAPYGETFSCADGKQIVLAVGNDRQFAALCEVLGQPELIKDPRFIANSDRVKNRKALYDILSPGIAGADAAIMMEKLLQKEVPAGQIKRISEVFEGAGKALILEDGKGGKRPRTLVVHVL